MASKLNQELINRMGEEIADGLPITYACDLLGISEGSYYNWMEQGEIDFNNDEETLYAALFECIKKSYATFIKECKRRIRKGEQGWQGTAWWLERTNTKFMPKQQIQADEDGKVNVIIGGKVKDIKNANNNK